MPNYRLRIENKKHYSVMVDIRPDVELNSRVAKSRENTETIVVNQVMFDNTLFQGAAWRSGLHVWLVMWRSWVRVPLNAPVCVLEQETLPLLISTGWNGFERDFTIELN